MCVCAVQEDAVIVAKQLQRNSNFVYFVSFVYFNYYFCVLHVVVFISFVIACCVLLLLALFEALYICTFEIIAICTDHCMVANSCQAFAI